MKFFSALILFTAFSAQAEDRLSNIYFFPSVGQMYGQSEINSNRSTVDGDGSGNTFQLKNSGLSFDQKFGMGVIENLAISAEVGYGFERKTEFIQNGTSNGKFDVDDEFEQADFSAEYLFLNKSEGQLHRFGAELSYQPQFRGADIGASTGLTLKTSGALAEFTSWFASLEFIRNSRTHDSNASNMFGATFRIQHFITDYYFIRPSLGFAKIGKIDLRGLGNTFEYDPLFFAGIEAGGEFANNRFMWLVGFTHSFGSGDLIDPAVTIPFDQKQYLINASLNYLF